MCEWMQAFSYRILENWKCYPELGWRLMPAISLCFDRVQRPCGKVNFRIKLFSFYFSNLWFDNFFFCNFSSNLSKWTAVLPYIWFYWDYEAMYMYIHLCLKKFGHALFNCIFFHLILFASEYRFKISLTFFSSINVSKCSLSKILRKIVL